MGNPNTSKNEGEGNKSADREYRQAATRHAASPKSEKKAREAEEALETEEGAELEEARQSTKQHQ
jgi:hypothetical protein